MALEKEQKTARHQLGGGLLSFYVHAPFMVLRGGGVFTTTIIQIISMTKLKKSAFFIRKGPLK